MDADFFLIRKMRQGDADAFDRFVRKYYADVLRYCAYHCSDTGEAEDLAQETLVHFFARFSDYHYKGKTKNYLYTVAGNLCKNYYKKQMKTPVAAGGYETAEEVSVSYEESAVNRAVLEWAFSQLEPDLLEVIDLYYFRELRLREIAETLHIGLPLVKYRMRKAKDRLRELLGKERMINGCGQTDKDV